MRMSNVKRVEVFFPARRAIRPSGASEVTGNTMGQVVLFLIIGTGVCLLVLGIALGGLSEVPFSAWQEMLGGAGLFLVGRSLLRALRQCRMAVSLRRSQRHESSLASSLTPQLFGEYSPYVIEAAEKLGQERDLTAVPALMRALEQSVENQRPGWMEQSAALANALAQIGDRRALPLLNRLDNVRGIGFIPAIRNAITAIEPHSSLLRPGSVDGAIPETLLRPAQGRYAEEPPTVLLRAVEASEEC